MRDERTLGRRRRRRPGGRTDGDGEREKATGSLGEHFAVGRLTRDELDERLELAWQAKTAGALSPLFADLPRDDVAVRSSGVSRRGPRPSAQLGRSPFGFPLPLLLIFAIVLTVATHVPFIVFLVGWLVLGRHVHRGVGHPPYALHR